MHVHAVLKTNISELILQVWTTLTKLNDSMRRSTPLKCSRNKSLRGRTCSQIRNVQAEEVLKRQARPCLTDWDREQQLNETAENLDVVSSGLQLKKGPAGPGGGAQKEDALLLEMQQLKQQLSAGEVLGIAHEIQWLQTETQWEWSGRESNMTPLDESVPPVQSYR